jgi:hypothetical protein
MWGERIFQFRDRFRRLDRKWHLLIGSQILVGIFAFRARDRLFVREDETTTATTAATTSATTVVLPNNTESSTNETPTHSNKGPPKE